MIARYPTFFIAIGVLLGCGGKPVETPVPPAAATPAAPPTMSGVSEDTVPTIVFLGTSLTAGYGLPDPRLAYPTLIQAKLDSAGLKFRTVNAGVSGETSAGALRRIDWVLDQGRIAVLMIETGANDGLRGQDPDSTRANIQAIIAKARLLDPAPKIILTGMEAMPNLGADFTRRFRGIFPELARTTGAALVPFLLEGVAGVDSLNQADGIHPTPRGQQIVAATVWKVLAPLLARR
jgi:acyl-CoA thioesterase-1